MSRCSCANTSAMSLPSTPISGSSATSSTVTSEPAAFAAAAVSSPIQPAPMMTTRTPSPNFCLQHVRVVVRAQVQQCVGARQVELARDRAGREHELVVAEDVAVGQLDLMTFGVELHRRDATVQGHVVVGVPLLVVHDRLLEISLALQVLLRQRRPLVRQVGLVRDEIEPALVALITQRLDGLRSGQAAADDDDALGTLGHGGAPLLDVVPQVSYPGYVVSKSAVRLSGRPQADAARRGTCTPSCGRRYRTRRPDATTSCLTNSAALRVSGSTPVRAHRTGIGVRALDDAVPVSHAVAPLTPDGRFRRLRRPDWTKRSFEVHSRAFMPLLLGGTHRPLAVAGSALRSPPWSYCVCSSSPVAVS